MRRIVIRFNAPVILTFAALSLGALILDGVTGGATTHRFFSVYRSSLYDPLTYVRMIGHVLGHAGYAHYMSNMLLLLLVGPQVEEKYGHSPTFWCILITAVVTGIVQVIVFPATALMGASGVVFMMIVLSSFTEMNKEGIPITLILVVVLYLGGELVDGLFNHDNVSQLTHIVGGVCGLIFGFTLKGRGRGKR